MTHRGSIPGSISMPSRSFITPATIIPPTTLTNTPTTAPITPIIADSVTTSEKIRPRLHPSTRSVAI